MSPSSRSHSRSHSHSRSRPRSRFRSRSRSSYTPAEIRNMKIVNFFDDVGIHLICRPVLFVLNLELLNMFDDIGISLAMRPLRGLRETWPKGLENLMFGEKEEPPAVLYTEYTEWTQWDEWAAWERYHWKGT